MAEIENSEQELKQKAKKVLKKVGKKLLIIFLPIILIIVLLAGAVYFITVDDGTYKDDDWGSTGFAASQSINNVTVNIDGTIESGMSAQEVWDKTLKNKGRVDQYLDSPEELARLMRAEIVTQYPDTRENPDEKINWEDIVKNEDSLQGIVKFKRADSSNNVTTMKYASPEEFQGYIDEYNKSGSNTAKQNALTHFTLKKSSTGTSSGVNYSGPDLYWPTDGTEITSYFGLRDNPLGGGGENHGAIDIGVPTGTNVYACEAGTVKIAGFSNTAGNWVVIDHGNGYVTKYMHNSELKVSQGDTVTKGQIIALSGNTGSSTGPHCHFQIEYNSTKIDPLTFKYNNGMGNGTGGFGTSDSSISNSSSSNNENNDNKNNNKKTNTQTAVEVNESGDGYDSKYTSSAGITYKLFKQSARSCTHNSYASNPYWDGTIASDGCGPSSIAILASGILNSSMTPGDVAAQMKSTSSENLKQEMDSLGMTSEVIQNPTAEVIQDNLKNGKVMLVSVNSSTIFTNDSHIMTLLDINDQGQVYVGNPGSRDKYGWYDITEITKGCKYIVVTNAGASGVAVSSNTSNYVAVVATWTQVDTTVTSDDPNVEAYSTTNYTMTTTNVNYQDMVAPYTVPFDLLWAFLVVGEDKNFVFDLTDLIYNSDIQITVYDNLTTNTDVDNWHYTQREKIDIASLGITAKYYDSTNNKTYEENDQISNHVHDPYGDDVPYNTVKNVVTQTNTINAILTRANVWTVDYKNDYTYEAPTTTSDSSQTVTQPDQEYPTEPYLTENGTNKSGISHSCDELTAKENSLIKKVLDRYMEDARRTNPMSHTGSEPNSDSGQNNVVIRPQDGAVDITETYNDLKHYHKYINISDNITNTVVTQKYTKGVPETKEKTDPDSDEPNFVTIFRKKKNYKNKKNIMSVPSWLFEIIENNESTKEMLDLVKYLLYKATGNNYGVTEISFEEVFAMKSSSSFGTISGNDVKEQVWNYLKSAGFSEEATAAVMGNMEAESGVDPTSIQSGGAGPAAGICQWENYNTKSGRWKTLNDFASSRGKDWTDLQCQLDFLMTELESMFTAYTGRVYTYSNGTQVWWPTQMTSEQFKKLTDVDTATEIFCRVFERPSIPHMDTRIQSANAYYNLYHGK